MMSFIFFLTLQTFAATLFGIDQIENLALQNKRIALLAHKASVDKDGTHFIDLTYPRFDIKKIFVPEHGLRSTDDGDIQDEIDQRTGLPIISLYKNSTRAPLEKDLRDIDLILIDLQDVGVRFYTYSSTIAEMLKAAKKFNKEVVILDRPNPNGREIEGNILEQKLTGHFISYHDIPLKHGMTLGELALMYNDELDIQAKLKIIPMQNWDQIGFDQNRTWIASSPAIKTTTQAQLYALWGALESANLSVGRSLTNDHAFHRIGAPWITPKEAQNLARELNQLQFNNVHFSQISWKIDRDIFKGEVAHGIEVSIKDFYQVDSEEFLFKVTQHLFQTFGARLIFNDWHLRYFGSLDYFKQIKNMQWEHAQAISQVAKQLFYQRRAAYLLY